MRRRKKSVKTVKEEEKNSGKEVDLILKILQLQIRAYLFFFFSRGVNIM